MFTTAGPAALTAVLKLNFFDVSVLVNSVRGRPLPCRKSGTKIKMIDEIITPIRIDFSKKEKDFCTGNFKRVFVS